VKLIGIELLGILSWLLNDLVTVELLGAERTLRLVPMSCEFSSLQIEVCRIVSEDRPGSVRDVRSSWSAIRKLRGVTSVLPVIHQLRLFFFALSLGCRALSMRNASVK
jgi:hypothetical protein